MFSLLCSMPLVSQPPPQRVTDGFDDNPRQTCHNSSESHESPEQRWDKASLHEEVGIAQADCAVEEADHQVHAHWGQHWEKVADCPSAELDSNLYEDDQNTLRVHNRPKLPDTHLTASGGKEGAEENEQGVVQCLDQSNPEGDAGVRCGESSSGV